MVNRELIEIRDDIDNILTPNVETCKSSIPHSVFSITSRLKDSLYNKNISDKEYKDEIVKILSLTSRFQTNCTCSETLRYFPKLAVRPHK